MHALQPLFAAMDADLLIAVYVVIAFLWTVWICCQLGQLAWTWANPLVYRVWNWLAMTACRVADVVTDRYRDYREVIVWRYRRWRAERRQREQARREISRVATTTLHETVRRDLHGRFARRLGESGYPKDAA